MEGLEVGHAGAFLAGLLSFLSPCVLPLVPPYLCFLAGVSIEQLQDGTEAPPGVGRRVLLHALAFVLGFTTVFVALGASASAVGRLVADHLDVLAKVAGVVIVLLGLHFLGVLRIAALYRELRFHSAARPAGLAGAYVIGLAFAFGCVAAAAGGAMPSTGIGRAVGNTTVIVFPCLLTEAAPASLASSTERRKSCHCLPPPDRRRVSVAASSAGPAARSARAAGEGVASPATPILP